MSAAAKSGNQRCSGITKARSAAVRNQRCVATTANVGDHPFAELSDIIWRRVFIENHQIVIGWMALSAEAFEQRCQGAELFADNELGVTQKSSSAGAEVVGGADRSRNQIKGDVSHADSNWTRSPQTVKMKSWSGKLLNQKNCCRSDFSVCARIDVRCLTGV